MSVKRCSKNDDGAIAVFYALMVVMLLTVAALGTDIGNAVSRKTSTQGQADFAAYNAAQLLDSSARAGTTPPTEIIEEVRDALNENQPQHDGSACWRATPVDCVTSEMLTDADLTNGDVRYTDLGLQVTAPYNRVNFGFANVFGASGISVDGKATVNIFSPGVGVLPMFAVDGCDYGIQPLTDLTNGQDSGTPNLLEPDQGNGAVNLASVDIYDPANAPAETVSIDVDGFSVNVESANFGGTTEIGFFKDDGLTLVPAGTIFSTGDGSALAVPLTDTPGVVKVMVPEEVFSSEGVWYIRAKGGPNNRWSPADEALPIRVGQVILECSGGPDGGNFGTLRIPRATGPNNLEIPLNIAAGLEDPLNLIVHSWGRDQLEADPAWNGLCFDGDNGAVVSTSGDLREDTNCVDTDPGLTANVATSGLVTGVSHQSVGDVPGLLVADTTCDSSGGTAGRSVEVSNQDYTINNDVLSCFLLDDVSLDEITNENYVGPALLSPAIFKSPRFAYVPVFAQGPDEGSSDTFSIVDFRAAFITDEVPSSSVVNGSSNATANNGLLFGNNGIAQVKVVFFNTNALPRDGEIPVIDYLGIGDPIVHLVD